MSAVYLDTSVLGRVLLAEPDAAAIAGELGRFERRISSRLLRVELRRLATREGMLEHTNALLAGTMLLPLDEEILAGAESIPPPTVATLDAIHLATAVRASREGMLDAVMTYDKRLAEGARQHGLAVMSPS